MLAKSIIDYVKKSDQYQIVIFEDLQTYTNEYHYHNDQLIKSKELDITNEAVVQQATRRLKLLNQQIIIAHTAAYVNTDKCQKYSYDAVKSNIYGTQLLINMAKQLNSFFIYFSTTAVFDPISYMLTGGKFDQSAKIDPKTIYGLTKYIGQISTKQCIDNQKFIVLKPVFFYGDAPFDNSSMIRKIAEKLLYSTSSNKLDVYLDYGYYKDYFRYQYFAEMFFQLLKKNRADISGKDYIISRNSPKLFTHYIDLIKSLTNTSDYKFQKLINIVGGESDYLKNHNGVSANFYNICPDFIFGDSYYDDDTVGIQKTIDSIKRLHGQNNN